MSTNDSGSAASDATDRASDGPRPPAPKACRSQNPPPLRARGNSPPCFRNRRPHVTPSRQDLPDRQAARPDRPVDLSSTSRWWRSWPGWGWGPTGCRRPATARPRPSSTSAGTSYLACSWPWPSSARCSSSPPATATSSRSFPAAAAATWWPRSCWAGAVGRGLRLCAVGRLRDDDHRLDRRGGRRPVRPVGPSGNRT